MSSESKKRKLGAANRIFKKPAKKPRIDAPNKSNGAIVPRKGTKAMRLDELQWTGVAMPDQLDDFEGFYGLEEVEDVEVVKDEETGTVSFKALEPVVEAKKDGVEENAGIEKETIDVETEAAAAEKSEAKKSKTKKLEAKKSETKQSETKESVESQARPSIDVMNRTANWSLDDGNKPSKARSKLERLKLKQEKLAAEQKKKDDSTYSLIKGALAGVKPVETKNDVEDEEVPASTQEKQGPVVKESAGKTKSQLRRERALAKKKEREEGTVGSAGAVVSNDATEQAKKKKKEKKKERKERENGTISQTGEAVSTGVEDKAEGDAGDMEWSGFSDSSPAKKTQTGHEPASSGQSEDEVNADADDDEGEDEELEALYSFAGLQEEDLGGREADVSAWRPLELQPDTMAAISRLGFSQPTLVQSRCIPDILAGHDVVGKAATGSGKTLAFGIPILEHYLEDVLPQKQKSKDDDDKETQHPTALIMAPTRELAVQLTKHLLALCTGHDFDAPRIATIVGGLSVQKQKRQLETADIIVGTPGRLWEVIESSIGLIDKLKKIRFLVVDEADRLLSQGNFKEVEQIVMALDRVTVEEEKTSDDGKDDDEGTENRPKRQTLVFSATFHKGLQQKLSGKARHGAASLTNQQSMEYLLQKLNFREEKPKFIDVNPISQMASGLKEGLIECAGPEKDLYLYALLLLHPKTRTLVFTNSISAVRRITPFLQNLNQNVQALHSGMVQKARLRAVEKFTASDTSILIATDVAARGLDIAGVQLVIHYHVPRAADMYIHRSGRTARASQKGSSILICAPEEVQGVRRLIAKVHAQTPESKTRNAIRTIDLDRRIVSRLRERAVLAKKIADVGLAKEKGNSMDKTFAQAAEDLGVEYDSEEFDQGGGRQGRGNKRKQKEREDRVVGKEQIGAWRAELRSLLAQRVNTGVSARYLTASGNVDVDALLRGDKGEFLGSVDLMGEDE